jgi:single-strand DNA-binding protein
MNDTTVTMIGNVLTAPEWRRTSTTATYVMTFRFAATSRKFDRMSGRWVDGDSLRLKVACWRTLGQNAFESIQLGDPLIISGRLYSRDWTDSDNHKRTSYELDAISLGHDLSRGVAKFARRRAVGAIDSINDAESHTAIGGETSAHVDPPELPAGMSTAVGLLGDFDPAIYDTSAVAPEGYREDEDADDDDEADEADAADESVEDEQRDLASVS